MAMIGRIYAVLSVMAATAGIGPATAFADDGTQHRAADVRPAFEPNQGQFSPDVRFASRGHGYTLFLTDTEAVLALHASDASDRRSAVRISLTNGAARRPTPLERLPGVINYLRGQDPTRWHTGIATYGRVTYPDVYPGVDIVYYAHDGTHEFDLVLAPRADPSAIGLRVSGADRVEVDAAGDLQLSTSAGTLTMKAPHVYQTKDSTRTDIETRYEVDDHGRIGFAIGEYDTTAPLVIDPQLVYSTYVGGSGNGFDSATGVAVDAAGAAYVVGTTETTDFPTKDPLKATRGGLQDAFVMKLAADGTRVYATYLGGTSYDDGVDIAVRGDGIAYVLGNTSSTDFPVPGAFQTLNNGSNDAYIVELNAAGSAVTHGTYLGGGGSDTPRGLLLSQYSGVAPASNVFGDSVLIYGSTTSTNFPIFNPGQPNRVGDKDGFLTVFDRQSLQPVFSSYAGLAGDNQAESLALNRQTGAMYLLLHRTDDVASVVGRFIPRAAPQQWDVAVGAIDAGAENDVVRTQDSALSSPQAAKAKHNMSFIGCREGFDVATQFMYDSLCRQEFRPLGPLDGPPSGPSASPLDAVRVAAVLPACLPVPPATQCSERASLLFYDANLSLIAHLNFGGTRAGREFTPTNAMVDAQGRIHVIGSTADNALPLVNPVQTTNRGSAEGFVLTFDPLAGTTSFFSYLGGSSFDTLNDIAVDADGNRWIVGDTQSWNFPTTPNAFQPTLNGRVDGFVTKIGADPPVPPGPTNLVAQTSGLNLGLSWNPVAGATSYQIEAGTAPLSSNLAVVNVGNVTALQTLGPAGTYYIRVRALTAAGLTGASNEVTVVLALPGSCTSAPPAPTGHTAQVANLNITLSWNASAGATSYVLQAGNASGASNLLNANIGATTALSAIGPPGTFFTRVRAVNACGTSGPSNEISFTLGCSAPPAAPTPLTFSKTATLLTLNWAASPGAASYRLRVGTTSGASNVLDADIGNTTGLQANVAGVPAASYFVRVVATNGCGLSGASNEVTIPIP